MTRFKIALLATLIFSGAWLVGWKTNPENPPTISGNPPIFFLDPVTHQPIFVAATDTRRLPVDLGTAEVTMAPLKVVDWAHYSATIATNSVSTLESILGSTPINNPVLIQCRTGAVYIGGSTETAAALQAGGHKLNVDDSFPIYRSGHASADIGIVADSAAVATISIFIATEQ
jgi:hypothetical protein